jgi:hypothetical protein
MKAIEAAVDYDRTNELAMSVDADAHDESRPRMIHRKARNGGESVEPAPESSGFSDAISGVVARAAKGSGQALPGELRGTFEESLGTDLGGVRIHTGPDAAAAAQALDARAYAVGQDVYMGAGEYDPSTTDGQFLIAHEVAHTVQQRGASLGPQMKLNVSQPGDAMETAADTAASAMISGRPASVGSGGIGIHRTPHDHQATRTTPLTAPQQQALSTVEHGGAGLSRRGTDDLLGLARTLGAAHSSQEGESRSRVARALVHLYDAMDAHLAQEFEGGAEGQMAFEFSEFSFIDIWEADAHAPRARRARPHRRTTPRPQPQPQAQQVTPPPTGGGATQAAPDVAGAMGDVHAPHVGEHGDSHTAHVVAGVAEVTHTAIELGELMHIIAHGAPWAMAVGLIAGGVASIVGPLAQIMAGDEFAAACQRSVGVVRSFCIGFADAVRGQPAHGDGATVGRHIRATLLARGATEAQLRGLDGMQLYRECWDHIHAAVVEQLVEMQRGGLAGTDFLESNAVPNAREIAQYWVNQSRL